MDLVTQKDVLQTFEISQFKGEKTVVVLMQLF